MADVIQGGYEVMKFMYREYLVCPVLLNILEKLIILELYYTLKVQFVRQTYCFLNFF